MNKTGEMFGMLFMLARTPRLQFNRLSLMNAGGEQKRTGTHGEAMRARRRQGEDKSDRR
jgi:hypothetical protein